MLICQRTSFQDRVRISSIVGNECSKKNGVLYEVPDPNPLPLGERFSSLLGRGEGYIMALGKN